MKKTYKITAEFMDKITAFEGLKLRAYRDAGGVITIGYGHTGYIKLDTVITKQQAKIILYRDLSEYAKYINALAICKTQGQFEALVSFTYNVGFNAFRNSTLFKKICLKADMSEIQAEFKKWVYCKGVKLEGLVRRRNWEAERFSN